MNIIGVHHGDGVLLPLTPQDDALGQRLSHGGGLFPFPCLFTPPLRHEWDMLAAAFDFGFGGPASCSVLSIAYRPALDPIETVALGRKGNEGECAEDPADTEKQCGQIAIHCVSLLTNIRSSFLHFAFLLKFRRVADGQSRTFAAFSQGAATCAHFELS